MRTIHLFDQSTFNLAVKEAQDYTDSTGLDCQVVSILDGKDTVIVETFIDRNDETLELCVMTSYKTDRMDKLNLKIPNFNT